MSTACSLRDIQDRFLAALYDDDGGDAAAAELVDGAGLDADARLRIYRNNSLLNHTGALRDGFPAISALVGEDFFDSVAMQYRRVNPSTSGNLQDFGAEFPAFLESLPGTRTLPYLGDVARLEWLRQEVALSALDASVRLLASPHAVLTIWTYAMAANGERLQLPTGGECVVLWRCDAEVAMAVVDAATFAGLAAQRDCLTSAIHCQRQEPLP